MHKIKSFLPLVALGAALFLPASVSGAAPAADPNVVVMSDAPYAAGEWSVSPFASYRAHELGQFNGKFGGGLALSYFPVRNGAVELETLSEKFDDSHWADAFTEAGVNFKGYLPIGATGLAPYGFIGYTRSGLDGVSPHQNRMNAGAGLELRAGKHLKFFADGRWTHDFRDIGHALLRLGGGLTF